MLGPGRLDLVSAQLTHSAIGHSKGVGSGRRPSSFPGETLEWERRTVDMVQCLGGVRPEDQLGCGGRAGARQGTIRRNLMRQRPGWRAVTALVCALALTLTAAACSSGSSSGGGSNNSGSNGDTTGINGQTIKVGLAVADLDGLRASGIQLAAAMTTPNLSKRITSYIDEWNAAGGINGYKFEPVVFVWDPIKPATQQKVCDDVTINNPVFMFINASGMTNKYLECIAAAGVPTFAGDVVSQIAHDTGVVTSIAPPAEVNATAGVNAAITAGQIPKGAKVGVMTGNGPETGPIIASIKSSLEKNGNTTTVVQINTLQGDVGIQNTESAAAVNTFKAAGVTSVIVGIGFTAAGGFWDNAGGNNWQFTFLDVANSSCTPYGGKSVKASAVGGTCYTTFGDDVTSDGKLKTETDFEKECRAHYDKISANDFGGAKSYPGVPSGETRTLPDGMKVSSDYANNECTLMNLIKKSLESIKSNLDRGSFMKAIRSQGEIPVAKASNGKGLSATSQTYLATEIHGIKLTAAPTGTAKNATGTYNGCPVDIQCWVPTSNTWYPVNS